MQRGLVVTFPICCFCTICSVNYLRKAVPQSTVNRCVRVQAGPAEEVGIADLELIDETRHYNVFMRVAIQIGNDWTSVNAGRHLCRPFELYVLRARAFARFLVTAATLRQPSILGGDTHDRISEQLPLEMTEVLGSCPFQKFVCVRLDLVITCYWVAQLRTSGTAAEREQNSPQNVHNIDAVIASRMPRDPREIATHRARHKRRALWQSPECLVPFPL